MEIISHQDPIFHTEDSRAIVMYWYEKVDGDFKINQKLSTIVHYPCSGCSTIITSISGQFPPQFWVLLSSHILPRRREYGIKKIPDIYPVAPRFADTAHVSDRPNLLPFLDFTLLPHACDSPYWIASAFLRHRLSISSHLRFMISSRLQFL
jgi:hypothetical protein